MVVMVKGSDKALTSSLAKPLSLLPSSAKKSYFAPALIWTMNHVHADSNTHTHTQTCMTCRILSAVSFCIMRQSWGALASSPLQLFCRKLQLLSTASPSCECWYSNQVACQCHKNALYLTVGRIDLGSSSLRLSRGECLVTILVANPAWLQQAAGGSWRTT